MSWDRGYDSFGYRAGTGGGGSGRGRRRGGYHNRDDYHRREAIPESPAEKMRNIVVKFGEADPVEELPKLETSVREQTPFNATNLADAVKIAVTEQPYKIPFYASLVRLLHNPTSGETETVSLGRQLLDEFFKGFQSFLDKQSWRDIRLCVQLYAHLTMAGVIDVPSFASLVGAFTSVLEEIGASYARAKEAALCAGEAILIAGSILDVSLAQQVCSAIRVVAESAASTTSFSQPLTTLHESPSGDTTVETLDSLCAALDSVVAVSWSSDSEAFPRPYQEYSPLPEGFMPYELPNVLVPPEVVDVGGLADDQKKVTKKDTWPEWSLQIFPDTVTPDLRTIAGYTIRSCLTDTIHIFEVNRKDCARILLEFDRWTIAGTFRPKPGTPAKEGTEDRPGWQLENTVMETIFDMLTVLPYAARQLKNVYYAALIAELCKLSPSTTGPALGKSIRYFYSLLGGPEDADTGALDVELARRIAEWFAMHMSNFNFQWVWKEWIDDLSLPRAHPKRLFINRAVELEIRLAYFERIQKSLPSEMQDPENGVLPSEAPGPGAVFDEPGHPHADSYKNIYNLFKTKASADDVLTQLEATKQNLLDSSPDLTVHQVDDLVASIAVQSLLSIGSRSFSHLLNAIERYLPLLRSLAGITGSSRDHSVSAASESNQSKKRCILSSVITFWWKANTQMVGIVFDKLMQYQIVEPADIVSFALTFSPDESIGTVGMDVKKWDLLEAALDKATGRVVTAKTKVATLRKEEDEKQAVEKAKLETGNDEMDVDAVPAEDTSEPSTALTTATKALTSVSRDERNALMASVEGFLNLLASKSKSPSTSQVITEASWADRAQWSDEDWITWETWGWWRHLCRAYSAHLRSYAVTIEAVAFAKLESSVDPAVVHFKQVWNGATGQSV